MGRGGVVGVALGALLAAAAMPRGAEARVNATGAIATFLIYDCATCTKDKNSIFCSEASGADNDMFVFNMTTRVTIFMKKNNPLWNPDYPTVSTALGPADGAKYCWSGTFGKLTYNQGNFTDVLGSPFITVNLDCNAKNLFYRQCVIPSDMAIILLCIGSVLLVGGITCICYCCGCCKCCNEKGDDSKWGCCNRFCPWCTLCADKHLREKEVVVEHAEERSLTGKSSKLAGAANGKPETGIAMTNPMASSSRREAAV